MQDDTVMTQVAEETQAPAMESCCGPSSSCACHGQNGAEDVFETKLRAAIEKVRPFLQMDGGDLELVAIEDNNALVRLLGACTHCPSSTAHMKLGVEQAIKREIPEFGELITID